MSLESLLGQFDSLADRSTNIAGIRKLLIINVINQATSRKGFLGRAVEVKASLTSQTKTKAGKSTGTRNQDLALPEVLLKIPTDAFARLGDVAEIEKGLTAIQKSKPGLYPLVVTAEARSTNDTFDFEGPAVVIPMVSSTGHGHASLKRIHYQEGKFAAGNILSVVKPKRPDILNTRFLFEYLTAFKEELLVSRMVGTANVSLTINGLRDIPIPLIQGEDVAKVDELMALCDRLESQLKERDIKQAALAKAALAKFTEDPSPENLQLLFHSSFSIEPDDLRKSILNLAVQGKLVPQDTNDEIAEETFDGLKALSGDSYDGAGTPSQWVHCSYRSLTTLVTSGSRGWKEFYAEKGSIFVRTQNIKTDKLVLDDVAFVDLPKSAEGMRSQVLRDDILVTITGANVTKAARIEETIPEAYVSQHIALTRPRWSKMSEWLHLCFISHGSARGVLERLAYGDKPGLNLNNIRDLVIPIPPYAEQLRVVEKVKQLMALVDALEKQLEASHTTGEKLLEAMVAELTSA